MKLDRKKRYYRRLLTNELGIRGGEKGAGAFILISKEAASGFMPILRSNVLNDWVGVQIVVPPSSRAHWMKYVWHNDSLNTKTGSRNEHRLYIGEFRGKGPFRPGAIISMRWEIGPVLIVEEIAPADKAAFAAATKALGTRNHALVSVGNDVPQPPTPEPLEPSRVTDTTLDELAKQPVFLKSARARKEMKGSRWFRDPLFRDAVRQQYNYRCSVSRYVVQNSTSYSVEAIHIIPVARGGSDNPANGLLLTRDLHWAFDKGLWTVSANGLVELHDSVTEFAPYAAFVGKKLYSPKDPRFRASQESLEWHRTELFGK